MPWISIGASLVGGLLQSNSADDAADSQQAATGAAIAEQRRQFDLTRGDYAPARNIGNNALQRLAALYKIGGGAAGTSGAAGGMSENEIRQLLTPQYTSSGQPGRFGPPQGYVNYGPDGNADSRQWYDATPGTVDQAGLDTAVQGRMQQGGAVGAPGQQGVYNDGLDDPIQMDPGYEFGLQQGQQALDRKTSAAGGRVSGASLKAAQEYGVNYATAGYQAAYGRRQDRINRLFALADKGQTATAGSAQAGDSASARNSKLLDNQGDATGSYQLARGNIWGNTANQIGAAAQKWITPPAQQWPTDRGMSWSFDK